MALLNKILVANRGEIALRIIRSARQLGIRTVAVYAETEKASDYVRLADEAVSLGSGETVLTFLNITLIIQIAVSTGSQAIHPGYGFLSENPEFAQACKKNQLIFIGPSADVLRLTGNKPEAKALAERLGIPVVFSRKVDISTLDFNYDSLPWPVLIKPSYGGGGKGIELVQNKKELKSLLEKSSRIALNYFGNGELFAEQYIHNARHVEVQIIGDNHKNIIHLYERDCSIQRNHQKIIEEAPATWLKPGLRNELVTTALKIGKAVNYSGAGTVEFLIDESGNYFFMEINPRIQVEHAVTEMVTGIDIIREQLLIASGFKLSVSQEEVNLSGHAIEARIYAEDPLHHFLPSSLPILSVNIPEHTQLRVETDLNMNQQNKHQFDPLLMKLIALAENRESALELLGNELRNLNIIGPETNTKYLETILKHPDFRQHKTTVEFCRNNHELLIDHYKVQLPEAHLPFLLALSLELVYLKIEQSTTTDPWNYLGFWRIIRPVITIFVNGQRFNIVLKLNNRTNPSFLMNKSEFHFKAGDQTNNNISVRINGVTKRLSYIYDDQDDICISCENHHYTVSLPGLLKSYPESGINPAIQSHFETGEIKSPLHGKILEINVVKNQIIKKGELMMVIEAMKSENRILSPRDAKVKEIAVNVGAQVTDQMPLLFLEELL